MLLPQHAVFACRAERLAMNRQLWVRVHRYAGLFMALFLVVAGLTGSVLAFRAEIDAWLNPPPPVALHARPVLDPLALRERLLAQRPDLVIHQVRLASPEPDRAFTTWVESARDPAAGAPTALRFQVVYQDPYTGAVLGTARPPTGLWPVTGENVIDVVYALHYRLALPGGLGKWLFGAAALVWTLDCFVGAYLTFPLTLRRVASPAGKPAAVAAKSWWARWWPAWRVKVGASSYRLNLDLHRAGGLWLWPMLFIVAWSAVGFNLPEQVYDRVMRRAFGTAADPLARPRPPGPTPAELPLGWREAHAQAQRWMAAQALAQGFMVRREVELVYQPDERQFIYVVVSDRDLDDAHAATYLGLDAFTGEFVGLKLPTGQHLGSTVDHWLKSLHQARVWGWPFKAFVVVLGLAVAYLSASGVYLWWKKRLARQAGRGRAARSVTSRA
jgi:uncharacterized iron-regulated membrane protein